MSEKRSRSEVTRQNMMRAAEKLFAEKGLQNVTARAIVEAAGQKNESALQYHFGGRDGLIREIHHYWAIQIIEKRETMLKALPEPVALRDIVSLMVMPSFELAAKKPDYRRYVKAFGPEVVLSELPAIRSIPLLEKSSAVLDLLRQVLPDLSDDALMQRLDGAIRFASNSMAQQARQKQAFRGDQAQLFLQRLIDAMAALLGTPPSEETVALEAALTAREAG